MLLLHSILCSHISVNAAGASGVSARKLAHADCCCRSKDSIKNCYFPAPSSFLYGCTAQSHQRCCKGEELGEGEEGVVEGEDLLTVGEKRRQQTHLNEAASTQEQLQLQQQFVSTLPLFVSTLYTQRNK